MDNSSFIKIIAIGFQQKITDDKPLRTCSEICIDIDNIKSLSDSKKIFEELIFRRKKYCIVELTFMLEYLQNKVATSIEIREEIESIISNKKFQI